jgi:lipoprotein NlpI
LKGDYSGAIADHSKALEIDPNDGVVYQSRAITYFLNGLLAEAARDFTKVIELHPTIAETYAYRGDVYYQDNKLKEAIEDFRKACQLRPRAQESFRLRLWLVRARAGEQKEATEELRGFLKQEGRPGYWLNHVADYLLGTVGEDEFLKTALRANDKTDEMPQKSIAYFYIGSRRLLESDSKGATEFFKKCIEAGDMSSHEYQSAKVALSRLKRN